MTINVKMFGALWNTRFFVISMTTRLSQRSDMGRGTPIWKTWRRLYNQRSSLVVVAIALYSASAKNTYIVFYFLHLHEIKLEPRNIQKPIRDFLDWSWTILTSLLVLEDLD